MGVAVSMNTVLIVPRCRADRTGGNSATVRFQRRGHLFCPDCAYTSNGEYRCVWREIVSMTASVTSLALFQ